MKFNKVVRLRIEDISEKCGLKLAISAEPNKGEPDEEDALTTMEFLKKAFSASGNLLRSYTRNTSEGDRIDKIKVWFPQ